MAFAGCEAELFTIVASDKEGEPSFVKLRKIIPVRGSDGREGRRWAVVGDGKQSGGLAIDFGLPWQQKEIACSPFSGSPGDERSDRCVFSCARYIEHISTRLEKAMTQDPDYQNNPLHGVSLKTLLTEIVDHYGFKILFAYLNINCFANNPSVESAVKFLKKTDWAREKVEAFYLYQFKSLPRASAEQFELPPRDRIVPPDQKPGPPAELSLEDAERLREKRAKKAALHDQARAQRATAGRRVANAPRGSGADDADPWAKWRK